MKEQVGQEPVMSDTIGVEEEFLVVDRETRELVPRGPELIESATSLGERVCAELNLCQIETETPVCSDLEQLRESLLDNRRRLLEAGEPVGLAPAAMATHPFSQWQQQAVDTDQERYEQMEDRMRLLAREQVICGCHIHVGIANPESQVVILRAARVWLSTLLALSTNSPYWQGEDSGYSSYRTVVWSRWPTSGMPPLVESPEELRALLDDLIAVGAIEDETHLYWWVRPSFRHPTIEFRVNDTVLRVDDAVAIAGLVRALCWTALHAPQTLPPVPQYHVLRSALWRASRYGTSRDLVDLVELRRRPAAEVVRSLVDMARPGLEHFGDHDTVPDLVERIVDRGTGASAQRLRRAEDGKGESVVDMVLERMGT